MINSGTKEPYLTSKALEILKVTSGEVNNETNRTYEIGKEQITKYLVSL